jgi:chromosome segregation ATPase
MADPTVERLAAELAWAASGAVREIEDLRSQIKMLEAANHDRSDVVAELQRHIEVQRRAADDRAELIERLHAEFASERDEHRAARAVIADDRDAALLEIENQYRAASEARRDIAHLQEQITLLQAACDERMNSITRLQAACDERMNSITLLQAACDERMSSITLLQAACDERLHSITLLSEQLRNEQRAHAITQAKLAVAKPGGTIYRTITRLWRSKRSD